MTIKLSKAYDDFVNTRRYIERKNFPDYVGEDEWEDVKGGYFYHNDACFILVGKDNSKDFNFQKYYLLIERSEYSSDDLTLMENKLFLEFAMGELDLLNNRK